MTMYFYLRVDTIDGIAMFSKFDISMIHNKKKHIHFTTIDNALDDTIIVNFIGKLFLF